MTALGAKQPGGGKWPKAEGQLSVYYAAKRTLTVICLSAVDNTQAPSLRDHLDESRNTMPAGRLRWVDNCHARQSSIGSERSGAIGDGRPGTTIIGANMVGRWPVIARDWHTRTKPAWHPGLKYACR